MGKVQYLIGWMYYQGEDTWEYMENLKHVDWMIREYEERLKLNEI
jgi:hypothetical protein